MVETALYAAIADKSSASHQFLQCLCGDAGGSSQSLPDLALGSFWSLIFSHRVCRQDDESFREEFLPACIFLLLLQVGIFKEQGQSAKFITT